MIETSPRSPRRLTAAPLSTPIAANTLPKPIVKIAFQVGLVRKRIRDPVPSASTEPVHVASGLNETTDVGMLSSLNDEASTAPSASDSSGRKPGSKGVLSLVRSRSLATTRCCGSGDGTSVCTVCPLR